MDPRVLRAQMVKSGFFTQLFDVDLGAAGRERVLARDVQLHPVSDQPIHVDFVRVSADHAVHVKVPVHFANDTKSPGLKKGGVLTVVRNDVELNVLTVELHEIEVVCSPDVIPHEVVVDLSGLEIGQSVHVRDLSLPAGVKPYHVAADVTVATVAAPTVSRDASADAAG